MKAQVVRITKTLANGRPQKMLGVKVGESQYLAEDGGIYLCSNEKTKITSARNVPPDAREALERMAKAYAGKQKEEAKYKKAQADYRDSMRRLDEEMREAQHALRESIGILSPEEFVDAFLKALPEDVRKQAEDFGYKVSLRPDMDGYRYAGSYTLSIRLDKLLDKWIPKKAFIVEEYDGAWFIADNPEKYPEYNEILRRNSKKITGFGKDVQGTEFLDVGDKHSLWYTAEYLIPVDEPLTEDEAKRLAKELCK